MKDTIKATLTVNENERYSDHLNSLIKQGEFLKLAQLEQQDPIWKGFIYDLKKGTMKFLLNATIHTLPTQTNLKMWNKSTSDKCLICKNKETTMHILNGCKIALDQKRYTWRHDNIVKYICELVDQSNYTLYSDIEGFQTESGGSIPSFLTITLDRPDIVIIDRKKKKLHIFELTVPFERNIKQRHTEKTNKYGYLVHDIPQYDVSITAFEVGSRGYIDSDNRKRLADLHKFCTKELKLKTFLDNISALSINSSYYIFCCRKEPQWSAVPPLCAPFN